MKIIYKPNFRHFYLFYYFRFKRLGYLLRLLGILLILSSLSFSGGTQALNLIFIIVLTTPSLLTYLVSFLSYLKYKKDIKAISYSFDDKEVAVIDEKKISSGKMKWEFFSSYLLTKDYIVIESTKVFLPVIFLAKDGLSREGWIKLVELVHTKVPSKKYPLVIKLIFSFILNLIFYVLLVFVLAQLVWVFFGVYNFECVGLKYCNMITRPKSNEWQEHLNKTYKYSFKYPPEMYVDKSFYNPNKEEKHVRLLFFNPIKKEIPVKNGFGNMVYENEMTVRFLGDNLSDEEIEAYDRQYKNLSSNDKESVARPEIIHGKIQYRYEKTDKINNFYYLNSIFVVDNRFFEISLRTPYFSLQLKEIYEKILDSVTSQ